MVLGTVAPWVRRAELPRPPHPGSKPAFSEGFCDRDAENLGFTSPRAPWVILNNPQGPRGNFLIPWGSKVARAGHHPKADLPRGRFDGFVEAWEHQNRTRRERIPQGLILRFFWLDGTGEGHKVKV